MKIYTVSLKHYKEEEWIHCLLSLYLLFLVFIFLYDICYIYCSTIRLFSF